MRKVDNRAEIKKEVVDLVDVFDAAIDHSFKVGMAVGRFRSKKDISISREEYRKVLACAEKANLEGVRAELEKLGKKWLTSQRRR